MSNPLAALVAEGRLPNVTPAGDETPATAHPDVIAANQELIERFEAQFTPLPRPKDPEWFGWIALPLPRFFEGMLIARMVCGPGAHRFLDVGSGIGTKLCLAHALGWRATGLELYQPYTDASRRLFPHVPVIEANAAAYQGYGDFDLIYCYGVATTRDAHRDIYRHITGQMRAGALLFAPRPPFPDWLEHVAGRVWKA